jgi:hypothetical protein
MATLIAAYNSEGCIGRCDAKCYNAVHPDCECICGGANHGAGINQAAANTEALAEKWIEEYRKRLDEQLEFQVMPTPLQLEMFKE